MKKVMILFSGLMFSFLMSTSLMAQTGSRVGGSSSPRHIVQWHNPEEVAEIRRLLERGLTDEAHEKALTYVEYVDATQQDILIRYYAHNALCGVLTQEGDYQAAIDSCSRAIGILPRKWSAFNNRGTARMLSEDYSGALADYEQALQTASRNDELASEAVNFNISLVRERME